MMVVCECIVIAAVLAWMAFELRAWRRGGSAIEDTVERPDGRVRVLLPLAMLHLVAAFFVCAFLFDARRLSSEAAPSTMGALLMWLHGDPESSEPEDTRWGTIRQVVVVAIPVVVWVCLALEIHDRT